MVFLLSTRLTGSGVRRRGVRSPLLLLVLSAAFFAPRHPAAAAAGPAGPVADAAPRLVSEPHPLRTADGRQIEAVLARFGVPEDRRRPGGARVELAFVRLPSTALKPGPPIVYLAGGPGGAGTTATEGNRLELLDGLRALADVIAFDQRGTGLSRPELNCSEAWSMPLDKPLDRGEMMAAARQHSRACAAELREEKVDLAAYNTNASADDLEDLRRALGVPKVALLGVSYGTHLALAMLRRHPDSVARAVLAGVEGPDQMLRLPANVQRLLERAGAAAGKEPQEPPAAGLVPALGALLERLGRQPVTVEVEVPLALRRAKVTVGREDLAWMIDQQLNGRAGIAGLPALVASMQRGDFTALASFALNVRRGWLGSAMPYAMQCASGASAARLARIHAEQAHTTLGSELDFPFPGICEAWGVPELGAAFRAPVRSDVPVLLISGTLDARTPPENAREVRRDLTHAAELLIEGGGHGDDLLLASPEIARHLERFLRGEPTADSAVALPPLAPVPPVKPAAGR
jgi:pimeloyl-ACP methyl ester carboxylesterase